MRMADDPGSLPRVWGHDARLQTRAFSSWPPLGISLTHPRCG
jgi:hypothetical protein